MRDTIIQAAKKTFIALKNPYGSVEKVYPNIISAYQTQDQVYYTGIKNCAQIPPAFVQELRTKGFYMHTLDKASVAGRAIDLSLKNPYTGLPMTGSSSGTAINVHLGINDIGIGTDGGGSVLAPAMAVNLIGFISPLLGQAHIKHKEKRISTDGIPFHPSLGCMSKHLDLIETFLTASLPELTTETADHKLHVTCDKSDALNLTECDIQHIDLSFRTGSRETLLNQLPHILNTCDVLISKEGPIDLEGFGDTVLGHHDPRTKALQERGNKGLIRVVNMAGATAITLPSKEFATGIVLICESSIPKIKHLLTLANRIAQPIQTQFDRYFCSSNAYYPPGFGEAEDDYL